MMRNLFGRDQEIRDAMEKQAKFLSDKDPLTALNEIVNWKIFLPELHQFRKSLRTNDTGRKPYNPLLMFKILILQSLYNLPDDRLEFMIHDRLSFMRFLGLGPADAIPDAKTIWRFRDDFAKAGTMERLFTCFNEHLKSLGLLTNPGQIIDASIVEVPQQHMTSAEKKEVAAKVKPQDWSDAKSRQKDMEATRTRKGGMGYFGYKNHVNVDVEHKLIRKYRATTASIHDSRVFDVMLDDTVVDKDQKEEVPEEKWPVVYADKAYKSKANEKILKEHKMRSCVLHRAAKHVQLTEAQKAENKKNARTRCRVEHVFGAQRKETGDLTIRAIGLTRVRCALGLRNLCYNMKRFIYLWQQEVVSSS